LLCRRLSRGAKQQRRANDIVLHVFCSFYLSLVFFQSSSRQEITWESPNFQMIVAVIPIMAANISVQRLCHDAQRCRLVVVPLSGVSAWRIHRIPSTLPNQNVLSSVCKRTTEAVVLSWDPHVSERNTKLPIAVIIDTLTTNRPLSRENTIQQIRAR
jgi:hypothetical protein